MCISTWVKAMGVGRAAFGLAALVEPVKLGRFFGFAGDVRLQTAVRYIACRDLLLGVGTVVAESHGHGRGWLETGMAVDAGDILITAWGVKEEVVTQERANVIMPLLLGSLALGGLLVAGIARGHDDAAVARARLEAGKA